MIRRRPGPSGGVRTARPFALLLGVAIAACTTGPAAVEVATPPARSVPEPSSDASPLAAAVPESASGAPRAEWTVRSAQGEAGWSASGQPSALASAEAPGGAAGEGRQPPFGVQVFEVDVDSDAIARIRAAGAGWARVRALWKLIEPARVTPAVYDWTVTDRLFGDTTAAGLRNLAAVYAHPSWAADRECGPVRPTEVDRYAAFWHALVERYDGDGARDAPNGALVHDWQVGNEVDFDPVGSGESDFGSCFGHDPAAYAEHLVIAWRAARSADPGARIGFGPVAYDRFTASSAPTGWSLPYGPYNRSFTRQAIEALHAAHQGDPGLPFFDFVGLHNYNDNAHFWDDSSDGRRELVAKVRTFRQEQLAVPGLFDLRSVPIVISETGLASSPSDEYTERGEELQAAYVIQAMVRGMAAGAQAVIWYTARDNIFGDCVPPHWDWLTFGLMRSDGYRLELGKRCPDHPWAPEDYDLSAGPASPRPALAALTALVATLHGSSFDRQLIAPGAGGAWPVEAYRFVRADGSAILVAWSTDGRRLGARGGGASVQSVRLDAGSLSPWTGEVTVVDRRGTAHRTGTPGRSSALVRIGPEPVFVSGAAR